MALCSPKLRPIATQRQHGPKQGVRRRIAEAPIARVCKCHLRHNFQHSILRQVQVSCFGGILLGLVPFWWPLLWPLAGRRPMLCSKLVAREL